MRLEIKRRPIAGNVGGIALRNQLLVIPATHLLSKTTDQDGDPLAISSVSPESFWGNPVRLAGTNVVYPPLAGFVGSDEFAFAVSDGRGGRTTAFFEAFVLDEPALLPNKVSIAFIPASTAGCSGARALVLPIHEVERVLGGSAVERSASREKLCALGVGPEQLIEAQRVGSFVIGKE